MSNTTTEGTVLDWIADHEVEHIALLQELVRQPSVPGLEYSAQDVVLRCLNTLGLDGRFEEIDTVTLSALPGFCNTGRDYENRPNVVARWKGMCGTRQ